MYKVVVGLKDIGEYRTFPEAFKALYEAVIKQISEGGMSLYALEQAVWIEQTKDDQPCVLGFDGLKDLAHYIGLLGGDGKLGEIAMDSEKESLVNCAFTHSRAGMLLHDMYIDMKRTEALLKAQENSSANESD